MLPRHGDFSVLNYFRQILKANSFRALSIKLPWICTMSVWFVCSSLLFFALSDHGDVQHKLIFIDQQSEKERAWDFQREGGRVRYCFSLSALRKTFLWVCVSVAMNGYTTLHWCSHSVLAVASYLFQRGHGFLQVRLLTLAWLPSFSLSPMSIKERYESDSQRVKKQQATIHFLLNCTIQNELCQRFSGKLGTAAVKQQKASSKSPAIVWSPQFVLP